MRRLKWWHFGFLGAAVLSTATVVKVLRALPRLLFTQDVDWSELFRFGIEIFLMGFASGVVVSAVLPISRMLGRLGDAIVGAVTMIFFFLMCMLIFDRSLLTTHLSRGLVMPGLGSVLGVAMGIWAGKGLRKPLRTWIR